MAIGRIKIPYKTGMQHTKYLILFFTLIVFLTHGQNTELITKKQISTRFEIGISRGIQLSKNFPILKSGEQINFAASKLYGSHFELGIGCKYQNLKNEQFTPIYLLLIGKKNPNKGLYIESNIGYSYGRNENYQHAINARFKGGRYFLTGIGYRFKVNNRYSFLASCNYNIQQCQVQHYNEENLIYIEDLMFDLIVFKLGVLLK